MKRFYWSGPATMFNRFMRSAMSALVYTKLYTVCTAVILLHIAALTPSAAHALTPTPAQIAQFKSLSVAEQKALAQSMGIEIPAGLGGGQSATTPVSNPQTVAPREVGAVELIETHEAPVETKPRADALAPNALAPNALKEVPDAKIQHHWLEIE